VTGTSVLEVGVAAAAAAVEDACVAVDSCDSLAEPPTASGNVGGFAWVIYHPNPIPPPIASRRKIERHQIHRDMLLLDPIVDFSHELWGKISVFQESHVIYLPFRCLWILLGKVTETAPEVFTFRRVPGKQRLF